MIVFQISRFIRGLLVRSFANFDFNYCVLLFQDEYGDYAINRDIEIHEVLTIGVGDNIEFESWLLGLYPNIQFTLVDPEINVTLKNSKVIKKLISKKENKFISYSRKKLDDRSYYYYEDLNGEFQSISIFELVDLARNKFSLIKLDIEGYEYLILDDLVEVLKFKNIPQILCELHWNWYDVFSIINVFVFFRKMRKVGFLPVWKSKLNKEFLFRKIL